MDSLSLRRGLDLFSRKDMHLLKLFSELKGCLWTILCRKSEDQLYKLICFKQDCFLFLSLGHTGPELSACYFSGIF